MDAGRGGSEQASGSILKAKPTENGLSAMTERDGPGLMQTGENENWGHRLCSPPPLGAVVLPLCMCCFLCLQAAGPVLGHSVPSSMRPSSTAPHSSSAHIADSPDGLGRWDAGLGVELSSTGWSWSPAGGWSCRDVCLLGRAVAWGPQIVPKCV